MAKKLQEKPKPKIITQHEWISIVLGNNRRLTASYGGEKATGAIPPNVWGLFSRMIQGKEAEYTGSIGERIQKFADNIDTIWPEWHLPPRTYKVGQQVKFDMGKRRGGPDEGEVVKVRGTSVTVRWKRSGLIGMTADMLDEYNKEEHG